ncbi:hypothetical protein C8Q77DRAFT_1076757 [Trametes polyzona]|nr:hypothetical protein C8Q77DRAFT_1076757 [Trametes polyzona]
MPGQAIPFDILLLVMDFASFATIGAMLRTCRTIYHGSRGPWLLFRGGVELRSDLDIISFARFLFADCPQRIRCLRSLSVSRGGFSGYAVEALAAILRHNALQLDSLIIHDAEDVLNSVNNSSPTNDSRLQGGECDEDAHADATLLHAFASLTTAKHLTIYSLNSLATELLHVVPSPLLTVSLYYGRRSVGWTLPPAPKVTRNPLVHLARFARTLEALDGAGFESDDGIVKYDVVYPHVRRVRARYEYTQGGAMPATAAYAHSFPAAEHLALVALPDDLWDPWTVAAVCATRERNRDDQGAHGSWRALRLVEGTLADVYVLGLVCHVREVLLWGRVASSDFQAGEMLGAVLEDVSPEVLELAIGGFDAFRPDRVVGRLCSKPAAQALRSLRLEVSAGPAERRVDRKEVASHILRALSMLRLEALTLAFSHGGTLSSAERTMEGFNTARLEKKLKDKIPSLQDVVVRHTRASERRSYTFRPGERDSPVHDESSDEQSEDGSTSGEEVVQELAELGFGRLNDEEDGGW